MPQLPTITTSVSARVGRGNAQRFAMDGDPRAYGALEGRALSNAGDAVANAGGQLVDYLERKQQEQVANAVAQADFTPEEVRIRGEVGPDGGGYHDNVTARYDEWVEEQANALQDDYARMEFRRKMYADRPNVSSRAALYEENQSELASKTAADASLMSLENQVMIDPTKYDKVVANGDAVIQSRPGLTAGQKQAMSLQWKQKAANSRFLGLLENAKSVEDLDAIGAELDNVDGKKDWAAEFNPTDFDQVRNAVAVSRKSFYEKANSDARAAIDTLNDRNNALTNIPDDELRDVAGIVKNSNDPILQQKFMRIQRDQKFVRLYAGKPVTDIRLAIDKSGGREYPNLTPEMSAAVNVAASRFDVSGSFLGSLIQRESAGDPNAKAETSSATGLTQFVDATWLETLKAAGSRMGVDTAGMSDQELLAMRTNPEVSIMAAAAYAEQNKAYLQSKLGRPINDAEMYIAHFLGPQGAESLLSAMATNPNANAADIVPNAAKSNRNVFYAKKTGKPKSVATVYEEIARSFGNDPSAVAYGDVKVLQDIEAQTEKGLKEDPMGFAQSTGSFDVQPLTDAASFASRGASSRAVADYYTIPTQDMQPFTQSEAADIAKQMGDGDSNQVVELLSNISEMGGDTARAGFKQVGQNDAVYGFAGALYSEGGTVAATEVVRGRKQLENNPSIKESIAPPSDVSNAFAKITGQSLFGIDARDRQAVQDAALAHYVSTYTSQGKTGLDENVFRSSINAVLGGTPDNKRLGDVNGQPTMLPAGVSEPDMNSALDRMTIDDWARMSPQKTLPRYLTGEIATPSDLANQARLVAIGDDMYHVSLDDGSLLITGRSDPATGRIEPYIFAPTAKDVQDVLTQPSQNGAFGQSWRPNNWRQVYGGAGVTEIGGGF